MTPLREDLSCDLDLLSRHCRRLLAEGCDGVSPFGTTGEGPAFSVAERQAGLDAILAAGVPASRILPGTGCASPTDTVTLTRHALSVGCRNLLVMPPFFFKDVTDEGVFRTYADLIERTGDPSLRIYIYNFPAMTGVWVRPQVIGRLTEAFGDVIAGVKDSSGDWDYVMRLIGDFPSMSVFSGWESILPQLLAAGGAGNVCGMANIIPNIMRHLFDSRPESEDNPVLSGVVEMVRILSGHSVIAALKALAANLRHEPAWRRMRPPLVPVVEGAETKLLEDFLRAAERTGLTPVP
jgi:4-hydroxy-tetrahydrodipicolinate synthase